jgi:hypothetical protein
MRLPEGRSVATLLQNLELQLQLLNDFILIELHNGLLCVFLLEKAF